MYEDLHRRLNSLGGGISFQEDRNTGYGDFHYNRINSSKNCKVSPARVEFWILNKVGKPLRCDKKYSRLLENAYKAIFFWDTATWSTYLLSPQYHDCKNAEDASIVLRTKSDFFWESLCQHFAEVVFGKENWTTLPLYLQGPPDGNDDNEKNDDQGIPDAAEVIVRVTSLGGMDSLNPSQRYITYFAKRGQIQDPEVHLEVILPADMRVICQHCEHLDLRPIIAGDRSRSYTLYAHIPRGRRPKYQNTDFPDFNLIYIPLRHLVFQGHVHDPKGPGGGIEYPDLESLAHAFWVLINQLRSPESSQTIVAALDLFITESYYYSYIDEEKLLGATRNSCISATDCDYEAATSTTPTPLYSASIDDMDESKGHFTTCPHSGVDHGTGTQHDVSEVAAKETDPAAAAVNPLIVGGNIITSNATMGGLPHFCVENFGLSEFRKYILGSAAGIGRGLSPDFGSIEIIVDGQTVSIADERRSDLSSFRESIMAHYF